MYKPVTRGWSWVSVPDICCRVTKAAATLVPTRSLTFLTRSSNLAGGVRDPPPAHRRSVMPTLADTSDHPARDQADYWRHLISSAFGPFHVQPSLPGAFAARLTGRTFGPVEAGDVRAPAHAVRRSARQIARDTRECYKLGLMLRGSCVLRQNGRYARVGAGDVVFYDLTRPVEISFDAHHIFTVVIPHRAVPLPQDRLAAFGGTLLAEGSRNGRLVSSLLCALAEDSAIEAELAADRAAERMADRLTADVMAGGGGEMTVDRAIGAMADQLNGTALATADVDLGTGDEPYAHHLGGAIVELVTGTASEWLGAPTAPSPEGAEMLRAIKEWIETRLHDPALSPAAIAEAHHISVRQLYRVFQPAGTTVARYVRTRRLEHCRRELGDPFLGTQRIGAIANRWGLPDAAAFSRAFRAAYGVTPTAYRAATTGIRRDL
ncbi:helix-turn-helix domain-containing protein [Actinomadura syzygii]|uniref:Helix-turn-helix domain-containing protein n=2 Tax=Actinomadura syzygii TaxID=1427538 RepID=A0A5D0TR08_9ACTN|nr:helix-turn-helix domain-containing protein [Actinomadura syzygii]